MNQDLQKQKEENEALFEKDFKERREIVDCKPIQVDIEITTRCNLRCLTCPKTYSTEKGAHIRRKVFDSFAEATFETARSVNLSGFGEPMLSPDFEYFFQRSVDAGLDVGFITNGTLLTEAWIERLLQARTYIFVSVDAATPETSRIMRPQLDFKRLVHHLHLWRRLRDQSEKTKAHLLFNFVPTRQNIRELPDVITLAANAGAERVEVLNMRLEGLEHKAQEQSLEKDKSLAAEWFANGRMRAAELKIDLILPPGYDRTLDALSAEEVAQTVDTPLEINPQGSKYPLACSAPWFRIYVNLQGDVFPCCEYPFAMGNLVMEEFDRIWNGPHYRRMRKRINTRFPQLGCKECQLVWGITSGMPDDIFKRERIVDRLHTYMQRLRRKVRTLF